MMTGWPLCRYSYVGLAASLIWRQVYINDQTLCQIMGLSRQALIEELMDLRLEAAIQAES